MKNPRIEKQIRYRDTKGHFISAKKARSRKGVFSEVYDARTGRRIGELIRGYHREIKKLQREAMPTFTAKKEKEYVARKTPKPLDTFADFSDAYEEDISDEEFESLEDDWQETYEADFGELDVLDDLESLLEDDDEWYEEA